MRNGSRSVRFAAPLWIAAAAMTFAPRAPAAPSASADVETLLFVRHGEKPPEAPGQLNCQGLNRALALPAVIAAKYGKPDAIYAASSTASSKNHRWSNVRELATVEPTAIEFGLPVQTSAGDAQTLIARRSRGRTVLIASERHDIERFVRKIVATHGGNAADVPAWPDNDFDSIYVVRIDRSAGKPRATFSHDHEGLDGRSADCPCAALRPAQ